MTQWAWDTIHFYFKPEANTELVKIHKTHRVNQGTRFCKEQFVQVNIYWSMCELRHGPSLIRWSNSSTSNTATPPPRVPPPPHQPQHKMKKIVQEIRKESTKNKICIQAPNNSRSNKMWIMILLISRVSWNEQRLVMLSQVWDFQVYL